MSLIQVLVVEDDSAVRRGVCDSLESGGYTAIEAESGEAAIEMAEQRTLDLVLLDIVLPGLDGLRVLSQIKDQQPLLPVIMLTARGQESDRVRGLKGGADDYIVKPFSLRELLARVEAVLRRCHKSDRENVSCRLPGDRHVDWEERTIRFSDGNNKTLSEREIDLLRYLVSRAGHTVSRDEVIQAVWSMNPRGLTTRTVDMHIARLREKLRDGDSGNPLIVTVRGRGYRVESH